MRPLLWSAFATLAAPALSLAQQIPRTTLERRDATVDFAFNHIHGCRELSDGRVLIGDDYERTLYLIDFAAGRATALGRSGSGPGEFESVSALHLMAGDSTLLEDRRQGRWLYLQGPRAVETINAITRFGYTPTLHGVDSMGRFLELRPSLYGKSPGLPALRIQSSAESLLVIVGHRSGASADTLGRIRGQFRGVREVMKPLVAGGPSVSRIVGNPLAEEEQAILLLDGWAAIIFADPYHVEWITPRKVRVRGPPLPFQRVLVDDAQKRYAVEMSRGYRGQFSPHELPGWPAILPPFLNDAVLALPDGRIAIRRTPVAGAGEILYDIVDRSGRLTSRIAVSPRQRIVGFGPRAAYVVSESGDDSERLDRYQWP